jgi:hypothetical protein
VPVPVGSGLVLGRFWAGTIRSVLGRSVGAGLCRSGPVGFDLGRLVSVRETTPTGTERHKSEKALFIFTKTSKKGIL